MDKILNALDPILTKLTWKRVMMIGTLVLFGIFGFTMFQNSKEISERLFGYNQKAVTKIGKESEEAVNVFMRKYSSVAYITILKFDFEKNTRVPIHRSFNNPDLRELVYSRLAGGDGALPVFIKDDLTNNNQMISMIQGTWTCDPFKNGGLARVWPDFVEILQFSCRVPIPPAFGADGSRGYMVAHLSALPRQYEIDTVVLDMQNLAKLLYIDSFGGKK